MAFQILALIQLHVNIDGMEQQLTMSAMPHSVLLDVCKWKFFYAIRQLEADRLYRRSVSEDKSDPRVPDWPVISALKLLC